MLLLLLVFLLPVLLLLTMLPPLDVLAAAVADADVSTSLTDVYGTAPSLQPSSNLISYVSAYTSIDETQPEA